MTRQALTAVLRHVRRGADRPAGTSTDSQLLDRFLVHRDEQAFEALVRRHGGLVLAACRRVLTDTHDIEDAFQATFLVLLRRTATIRQGQALGAWLYRVASRVSVRARADIQCRRRREEQAATSSEASSGDPSWREACSILHAELNRLPVRFRLPLVLCYLDGKTRDEAARQLGWSLGTLRGRLERGRLLLRARLTRRGVSLSVGLLAAATGSQANAVGPALVQATVTLARGVTPSAAVTALAAGAMRVAIGGPAAIVAGLVIVAGLCVGVIAAGRGQIVPASPPAKPQAAPLAAAPADDAVTYAGQVLGPDGKPIAGATLTVVPYTREPLPALAQTAADADGRFRLSVARTAFAPDAFTYSDRVGSLTLLAAAAPGYGVGWVDLLNFDGPLDKTVVRLAREDQPIRGRVIDLEGRPVAGATVRVLGLLVPKAGDLTPWLATLNTDANPGYTRGAMFDGPTRQGHWMWPDLSGLFPPVATGPDGRFRIDGVGRERIADLRIEGPTIQTCDVAAMTRSTATFTVKRDRGPGERPRTYYGNTFDHVAGPSAPIVGVVRDWDTGQPIAGAVVESDELAGERLSGQNDFRAVADAAGHYRITGMPRGGGHTLVASPPVGQPYLMCTGIVPSNSGTDPITVDIRLKLGVWIEGKVTDRSTGLPVHGNIQYFAVPGNPHVKEVATRWETRDIQFNRADDGTFRLVGLPGRGFVAFRHNLGPTPYPTGAGADRLGVAIKDNNIITNPRSCDVHRYHGYVAVDAAPGATSVSCAMELEPGRSATGTVLDPDGRPLNGALIHIRKSFEGHGWDRNPLSSGSFTVVGLTPDRPARVLLLHRDRRLAGAVWVRADEAKPTTVALVPWAVVTGRLLSPDGEPLANATLNFTEPRRPAAEAASMEYGTHPDYAIRTDPAGRFRIDGLIPGLKYELAYRHGQQSGTVFRGMEARSGETRDLGDVRGQASSEN